MDLLERAPLLDELDGVLAATTTGGRVVLVAGEAGIGKSALVRRFAERHSADARFLLGACDPLLTPRALGPLHDLGRHTGGRLAALLAAGSPREQLFAALLDELDRGARPQVVVVEDAHWADEATLDLLVFLGRRMDRTRALLIVTYRDDEGKLVDYVSEDVKPSPADLARGETRKMDCLDCHNRPSHAFELPERAVDRAITEGRLSRDLPFVKKKAVELLRKEYPDRATAEKQIADGLLDFYRTGYPEVYRQRRAAVESASVGWAM